MGCFYLRVSKDIDKSTELEHPGTAPHCAGCDAQAFTPRQAEAFLWSWRDLVRELLPAENLLQAPDE